MGCCGSHPVDNLTSKTTLSEMLVNKTEKLKVGSSFDDSSSLSFMQVPYLCSSVNHAVDVNFCLVNDSYPSPEKSEILKSPDPLQCENNHILSWNTQLIFDIFQTSNSWTITCQLCLSNFSSFCWHCDTCNYSVCESCGNASGIKAPYLKCRKNHRLLWSPETIWYYRKDSTSEIFACDICKEIKHEPSWNCDQCGFDICITCGEKFNIKPCERFLEFCFNHRLNYVTLVLDESLYESFGILCKSCQKWIDPDSPFFQCEVHDIDVCLKCADDELKELVPHPGFRCKDGKTMKIIGKDWVLQEFSDNVACDLCKSDSFDYSFMCTDCFLCYCFTCSKDLHTKILNCHTKSCKIGHPLQYKSPEEGDFICNTCRDYFQTGFFTCECPNYKLCPKDLDR